MITLITGLPGHGKGVYSLDWLITRVNKENKELIEQGKPPRPVYYNGISDCKIPDWIELEKPEEWFNCPAGSFILIDECQRLFRVRSAGAQVPKMVSELETHRHHGFDLVFITQHPMLIDQNVRRLVGQHFHIIRKFGMTQAVVHEWNQVREQPQNNRKDSIRHDYSYNKKIYGLYKSAEIHTVKKRIPMKYYLMFIFPVVAIVLIYFAFQHIKPSSFSDRVNNENPTESGEIQKAGFLTSQELQIKPNYLESRVPRVQDLPYSAPVYDELTKPTVAPRVAGCVLSHSKGCTCYTQQGTTIVTSNAFCKQVVENGFFQDFDDKNQREGARSANASLVKASNDGVIRGETPNGDISIDSHTFDAYSRPSPLNAPQS